IARAYGLNVHEVEASDWRTGITFDQIKDAVRLWPHAKVVFVTWSESSTGVLIELNEIGRLLRDQGRILVADAVSGLAVSPMEMDVGWVGAVVVGSKKVLMRPPGQGLIAVMARAGKKSRTLTIPRF